MPPGNTTTDALDGTSSGVTTSSPRAAAEGSLPAAGPNVGAPDVGGDPGRVVFGPGPTPELGGAAGDEVSFDDDRLVSTMPVTPTSRPTTTATAHFHGF